VAAWLGRIGADVHMVLSGGSSTSAVAGGESGGRLSRWGDGLRYIGLPVWWQGWPNCQELWLDDMLPTVADLAERSPDRHTQVRPPFPSIPPLAYPLTIIDSWQQRMPSGWSITPMDAGRLRLSNSAVRVTQASACEFLHAAALFIIGKNARAPSGAKVTSFMADPFIVSRFSRLFILLPRA
jgi:hypothetical protein